ncbi:T9SS type A sorting domain-containing protein [Polaribacter sp.]|nr:T9SS type A sorting domain-containing protein [Polaribacter sp.]
MAVAGFGSITDRFIYIVRDVAMMQAEFPSITFETNASVDGFNTIVTNTATNGNDGYQLILNGVVVSQFGKTDTDADDDTIWEHDDSVVSRKSEIADTGAWDETHWVYSGKNSLDGNTKCKGGAGAEAYLSNLGGDFPLQYGSGNGFTLTAGTGSFTFTPQAPLNRPPVEIFYHIPDGDITTMPILMSLHGAARNGESYRDYWIQMANDNGFIAIAPEFSAANYPELGDHYLMSNIFDDGDNPSPETFNDQSEWTFSILDPLFEYVKVAASSTQETYNAWGHSGGAQFLHRFVTYLPNSKLDIAVCSNAGWYTVAENGVRFPYGIDNGQLPTTDLITAYSKKLIVHLGKNDTNSDSSTGIRRNGVVDAQQGIHRFERGQYFFNTSQATAQNMEVSFNWEKQEVAGIGHQAQLMATDALQYFLPSFLSVGKIENKPVMKIYPNPTNIGQVTIDSPENGYISVQVYDVLGKQVKKEILISDVLSVSDLTPGLYIVQITQNGFYTTKKLLIK